MVVWLQKVSKWEYLDEIANKTKQTSDVTLDSLWVIIVQRCWSLTG